MYKILTLIKNIFQNHFELSVVASSTFIVLMAIMMDWIFFLQACPLCILTRYVFVLLALTALIFNGHKEQDFWSSFDSSIFKHWTNGYIKTDLHSKHVFGRHISTIRL